MRLLFVLTAIATTSINLGAQTTVAATPPAVALSTRLLPDGSRSVLALVQQLPSPVDDVRIELPENAAQSAVLLTAPAGWTIARDGSSARVFGVPVNTEFRLRITLFDVRELSAARVRLRLKGRDLTDLRVTLAQLPPVEPAGPPLGLLAFPNIVSPGETIDVSVLNPKRTPDDGQWFIAGVPATPAASNRLRVQLPNDLEIGAPLRITYFDVWGERLVEALAADDVVVTNLPPEAAPRITGCARYGFLGESLCVCGHFPESSWGGIRVDGQPATVTTASRHVLHISLPTTLAPGAHTISGDAAVGFPAGDSASAIALRLQGSIDSAALLRGQSTSMRLAIEGATEPMKLLVANKTPFVVSIPGGNLQEVDTSGGTPNAIELRVNATGKGNFSIDYRLDAPPCPCQEQARAPYISTASRPVPLFVPRRVVATITAAAPALALATAQAVALANSLAVVDVVALPAAGAAMVVFEITDGIGVVAKSAALAADPRVTLSQPDFIYDTSQGGGAGSAPAYGVQMIGADVVQSVSNGEGVRVGIVDAGVDNGHPRLAKKIAEYTDVTATGWTPDAHGTLVAGVIAGDAAGSGAAGGVAPGVQLVAIKSCVALSSRLAAARCWSSTLARGIEAALQRNVRVLNLSVGGPEDRLLGRMVDAAAKRGVVVISAAGNDGPTGKPSYPAAIDNVIAVTAVDVASRLYPQATRGEFIDIAAPGVDVISTGPGGREQLFSGTSAATAFTSGAVALLLQKSKLNVADLRTLLRTTAKDLGPAGHDRDFGDGLIDVCRAAAKAMGRQIACR